MTIVYGHEVDILLTIVYGHEVHVLPHDIHEVEDPLHAHFIRLIFYIMNIWPYSIEVIFLVFSPT